MTPTLHGRGVKFAHVVKAFNSIGIEVMAYPHFAIGCSVLWLCGDDAAACDTVATLTRDIGFEPVRLDPLARARFLEPAALPWITARVRRGRASSRGACSRGSEERIHAGWEDAQTRRLIAPGLMTDARRLRAARCSATGLMEGDSEGVNDAFKRRKRFGESTGRSAEA